MPQSPPPLRTPMFDPSGALSNAWQVWFSQLAMGGQATVDITLEGDVVGEGSNTVQTEVISLEGGKPIAKVATTNDYNDLDNKPDLIAELVGIEMDVTKINALARQPGAGGADSSMLVCFNEYGYDPVARFDSFGSPQNCVYDFINQGLGAGSCIGDINYVLLQDIAPCASVETLVMWAQWWTVSFGTDIDMTKVRPGINSTLAANIGSLPFNIAGYTSSTALQLPGLTGGSSNDEAFLAAAQLMAARGYKIGVAPVVIGVDTVGGGLQWRGYFSWGSTSDFTSWVAEYKTFVKHYFDLLNNANISIEVFYVGSEFQGLAQSATNAIWALWVAALQNIADYVKVGSPNTRVVYASNWAEYGWGATFRTDSIFTYTNMDCVGIDWYPPISLTETNDPISMQSGLKAGEQFDYYVDSSSQSERSILTSSRKGKTLLTQNVLNPVFGAKNLQGFWENNHYLLASSATAAEATPQDGYDRTYDPNGMGSVMSTIPAFGLSASLPAASSNEGTFPPPGLHETWAAFDGSTVASFTLPTWSTNQYFYEINFDFKVTASSPANGATLFNLANIIKASLNTSTSQVVLTVGTSAAFNLCVLDTAIHTITIRIDVVNLTAYVGIDGADPVAHTVTSSPALTSAATMFVGGASGSTSKLQYNLYKLQIFESVGSSTTYAHNYGGTFYFDEPYCGVRTAWSPKCRPIRITETGVATVGGSAVEPNVYPTQTLGSTAFLIPTFLDSFTLAIFKKWIGLGWTPVDVQGPYGSNFAYDEVQQAAALKIIVEWLSELEFVESVSVYAFDVRPFSTILSQYKGKLYYIDAPLYLLSQTLNGKLAGGVAGNPNPNYLL